MKEIIKKSIGYRKRKLKATSLQRLLSINKRLYHTMDFKKREYLGKIYYKNAEQAN